MSRAQIIDGLHYIKTLKLSRLWNASKIFCSYFISKWTKKNYHRGYPIAISIEPTTSCNLRCPECPSGLREFSRPTGMLQEELNHQIISDLSTTLTYITYYFQGEPYLNPKFTDMVKEASEKNIYTATSTNAHYLTDENCKKTIESGLKRLIISIDGVSQDAYGKYRIGGQINKVLDGTENILRWKKKMKSSTPFVMWQFIVFKHNEHELPLIKAKAKELGVDHLAIKTAQLYHAEDKLDILPSDPKYRRYDQTGGIKNKLLDQCWRMWHACVITWDGKITPCCFDKDASHQLGDVNTDTVRKIWRNSSYQSFRTLILKSRSNIDICRNCSEGTKIWS